MNYKLYQIEGHLKLIYSARAAYNIYAKYFLRSTSNLGGYLTLSVDNTRNVEMALMHGIGNLSSIHGSLSFVDNTSINAFYDYAKEQRNAFNSKPYSISKEKYVSIGIPRNDFDMPFTDVLSFFGNLGKGNDCIVAWAAIDNGYITSTQALSLFKENKHMSDFLKRMKEHKTAKEIQEINKKIIFSKDYILSTIHDNKHRIAACRKALGITRKSFIDHVIYHKIDSVLIEE